MWLMYSIEDFDVIDSLEVQSMIELIPASGESFCRKVARAEKEFK